MAVYVLNFTAPDTVEDLEYFYDECDGINLDLLYRDLYVDHFTSWTVGRSTVPGDVVFIACARTARDRMGSVRAVVRHEENAALLEFANSQYEKYKRFSGKLLMSGVVSRVEEHTEGLPYGDIVDLRSLNRPIDVFELKPKIKLSNFGSVTKLDDEQGSYLLDYANRSEIQSVLDYTKHLSDYKDVKPVVHHVRKRPQRDAIPKGLRYDVLKRDGFRCALCGRDASDGVHLHVDHIKPVALGGETVKENLRTLCQDCNLGKRAKWDASGMN